MTNKTTSGSKKKSDRQVERLHNEMVELIKRYQFRDRNRVLCHGISVTQCYILETLQRFGALTMTELANRMHLTVSTVTRVIEPLVNKKYIARGKDANDGRIRVMRLTARGERVAREQWRDVVESEKEILARFPAKDRETLISFLEDFNRVIASRRDFCSTDNT